MNDRIRMAFARPSALADCDLIELVAAMRRDATKANRRQNRSERVGENYGISIPQYRSKIRKWMKRRLTDDEKAQLKAAWGN